MSAWYLIPAAIGGVPAIAFARRAWRERDLPRCGRSAPARFLARLVADRAWAGRKAGLAEPDPHDPDTWQGAGELAQPGLRPLPVLHYWPALGSDGMADCCGADPFGAGLPMTPFPEKVTCPAFRERAR